MRYFLILMLCLFAVGCTKYYKVTKPGTDNTYYTTKIKRTKSGSIKIKDEATGKTVTLQSSEIEKITENQFDQGVLKQGVEATQ